MELNAVIMFITCIICLFIFGKIFIWPLKNILKLVFNSILGGILIYVINLIGMNFGFHIGLNLVTATTVGVLGVPGAILLVILKIILRIEIHITKIKGKNFKSFPLEKIYAFIQQLLILQDSLAYQHPSPFVLKYSMKVTALVLQKVLER